jgi:adenine-specific DNA-methyltransferase
LVVANSNSNDLILDFFAGSGTTGDAVMQLNSEDGGNRKFILVQWPEEIDEKKNKTAFDFVMGLNPQNSTSLDPLKGVMEPTIFEITKERLIRTGKKIQLGQKEKNDKKASQLEFEEKQQNLDLGFKIFETMPIWEDYEFIAEKLEQEGQELFDESKLTEEDLQTLLTTWQAKDGILLTENLAKIDLDSYFGYYHHFKQKLYLMDKGFETKNLVKLIGEIDENPSFNPKTIVCFGHNWTESMKIRETFEGLKNYSNKKKSDIDLEIRY